MLKIKDLNEQLNVEDINNYKLLLQAYNNKGVIEGISFDLLIDDIDKKVYLTVVLPDEAE